MAENDANNQAAPAPAGSEQAAGPQFALQRIYLKDASFESPRSPAVFQGKWAPRINFDIKTRSEKLQEDSYEVVLILTAEAHIEDKSAFLVEVHQAGIFTARGFDAAQLEQLLATTCPTILFPYARESIDSFVIKGSFPPLMLSPINFDALYTQQKQQQAAQANAANAGTDSGTPVQ